VRNWLENCLENWLVRMLTSGCLHQVWQPLRDGRVQRLGMSFHTHACAMGLCRGSTSGHTHSWVMARTFISYDAYTRMLWHTHSSDSWFVSHSSDGTQCVVAHTWMSPGWRFQRLCTYCHTHGWVMAHTFVSPTGRVTSHGWVMAHNESWHSISKGTQWVMAHNGLLHRHEQVTHEQVYTDESKGSVRCVTHLNAS